MIGPITVAGLLQFYALLAGLLGLAFWVGALNERVKACRIAIEKLQDDGTIADAPTVVRLEEKVQNLTAAVEKLVRGMDGVQRQIGNFMRAPGKVVEMGRGD